MSNRLTDNRIALLAFGLLAGLCLSAFWPHQPLSAATSDREKNFGMITVAARDIALGGVSDKQDAVFVLDYVTGRLQGAVLNSRSGTFSSFYFRDVAADFDVDPAKGDPHYAMVTGVSQLPARGRVTWANGVIYVGELSSGKIHAYAFPYNAVRGKQAPVQMTLVDGFPFRQPMK